MTPASDADRADKILAVLLENHRGFLAFLESRVGSRHDAEEILQSAFVRSLQKADQLRDTENAIAWFYRLLRRAVIDHYRKAAVVSRTLAEFARQVTEETQPLEVVERAICQCVKDLLPTLKPEYAELITQVDLDGESVVGAAKATGVTAGHARVRLHRARLALYEALQRTCRTCATHGCVDCSCGSHSEGRPL